MADISRHISVGLGVAIGAILTFNSALLAAGGPKSGHPKATGHKTAVPKIAGPKTALEFATRYMAAFNAKDAAAIKKLQYPRQGKSSMQEMLDEMNQAEMSAGTQYNKFEILPPAKDMDKPTMGPDGVFYVAVPKPTNLLKLTAETKTGKSSTTMPIGVKDGIFYQVALNVATGVAPDYKFGWQRFSALQNNWSVMLPNEPEPGRAALEHQYGKDALKDTDIYGVVKNTASIKTTQHWYRCGEEGKRINDDGNKETYRAACTTYSPESLKEWFNDPKKNLDEAVDMSVRRDDGKLIQQKDIDLAGSPGREFEIRCKDGTLRLGRVYWIKDALYELTFDSKKETPDRAGAEKFLSSLQTP